MNKSCKYCGGIHPRGYICKMKPKPIKKNTIAVKFRRSRVWQNKAEDIKKRDMYLCQVCVRGLYLYNNGKIYNYTDLQVHHAIPIMTDYDKRLDDDNLITLCPYHHKMAETGKIPFTEVRTIIYEQEAKRKNIPPMC